MTEVTLEFIAERLERIQEEQAVIRAELAYMRGCVDYIHTNAADILAHVDNLVTELESRLKRPAAPKRAPKVQQHDEH